MTKEQAIQTAKWYLAHKPHHAISFYRTGREWMTTTQSESEVRALYKRRITSLYTASQMVRL